MRFSQLAEVERGRNAAVENALLDLEMATLAAQDTQGLVEVSDLRE